MQSWGGSSGIKPTPSDNGGAPPPPPKDRVIKWLGWIVAALQAFAQLIKTL